MAITPMTNLATKSELLVDILQFVCAGWEYNTVQAGG